MAKMNEPIAVRNNVLKNRIAMLPVVTFSLKGDNGEYFGEQHKKHYEAIANGGPGLVIVQGTNAKGSVKEERQWTPACQKTLKEIASIIKSKGALAMIQLSFGGDLITDINALDADELKYKQEELRTGAIRAWKLGFDGVEIHFGHGFSLCKLLDAEANQRTDQFGGTMEKRAGILTDIIPSIRTETGDDFIIGVRMGAYLPDLDTAQKTAKYLESKGVDLFNITFSVVHPDTVGPVPDDFPMNHVTYSGYLIKQVVNVPVIGVKQLDTEEKVRLLLEKEYADIAGAATPILADYDFPNKIMSGQPINQCRHCDRCFWFTDHTLCPARKSK